MMEKKKFELGDCVKSSCCSLAIITDGYESGLFQNKWRYGAKRKVGRSIGFVDYGYAEDFELIDNTHRQCPDCKREVPEQLLTKNGCQWCDYKFHKKGEK